MEKASTGAISWLKVPTSGLVPTSAMLSHLRLY